MPYYIATEYYTSTFLEQQRRAIKRTGCTYSGSYEYDRMIITTEVASNRWKLWEMVDESDIDYAFWFDCRTTFPNTIENCAMTGIQDGSLGYYLYTAGVNPSSGNIDVCCMKIVPGGGAFPDYFSTMWVTTAITKKEDGCKNAVIAVDSNKRLWVAASDEFTSKGKQRFNVTVVASTTTMPTTIIPTFSTSQTAFDGSTETGDTGHNKVELVPCSNYVGVIFSNYDATNYKLKERTGSTTSGTVFTWTPGLTSAPSTIDSTINSDMKFSSESDGTQNVFITYKDYDLSLRYGVVDVSAQTVSPIGTIYAGSITTLSITKSTVDGLYSFYVDSNDTTHLRWKISPVQSSPSWGNPGTVDHSSGISYLGSYVDHEIGVLSVIKTGSDLYAYKPPAQPRRGSVVATGIDFTYGVGMNSQRHSFHAKGRYWVFYVDAQFVGNLYFISSTNNVDWSSPTYVKYLNNTDARCFSVFSDGTYVCLTNSIDPYNGALNFRRGTLNTDGTISWGTEYTVRNTDPYGYTYMSPTVCTDAVTGLPFIGYSFAENSGYDRNVYVSRCDAADGSGTWTHDLLATHSSQSSSWMPHVIVMRLSNGYIYALWDYYFNGSTYAIYGKLRTTSWQGTETCGSACSYPISGIAIGNDIHACITATWGIGGDYSYSWIEAYYVKRTYGSGWGSPEDVYFSDWGAWTENIFAGCSITGDSSTTYGDRIVCFVMGNNLNYKHFLWIRRKSRGVWEQFSEAVVLITEYTRSAVGYTFSATPDFISNEKYTAYWMYGSEIHTFEDTWKVITKSSALYYSLLPEEVPTVYRGSSKPPMRISMIKLDDS